VGRGIWGISVVDPRHSSFVLRHFFVFRASAIELIHQPLNNIPTDTYTA
jgi:hypothetical protein